MRQFESRTETTRGGAVARRDSDDEVGAEPAGRRASIEGRVTGIWIASEEGAPMEPRSSVRAIPGRGLEGDRYSLGRGHWMAPGQWDEVTLVSEEDLEAAGAELGAEIQAAEARRNLVLQGVRLAGLEGSRFRVGGTLLEGIRACSPCRYLEELAGRPGLKGALRGRGGLRARIVEGGRIEVGDRVELASRSGTETPAEV